MKKIALIIANKNENIDWQVAACKSAGINDIVTAESTRVLRNLYNKIFSSADTLITVKTGGKALPQNIIDKILKYHSARKNLYTIANGNQVLLPEIVIQAIDKSFYAKNTGAAANDGSFKLNEITDKNCYWFDDEDFKFYFQDNFDKYYKYPRALAVDICAACNLQCPKCQYHAVDIKDRMKEKNRLMDYGLYRKIIDQAAAMPQKPSIYASLRGEPLLHPKIVDMLKYAKSKNLSFCFSTNAALLTKDMSKKLIDAGLDAVTISIDAVKPETYDNLQAGGNLSAVEKNIEGLLELRGGLKKPSVTMVYVIQDENKAEINAFSEKWTDKVEDICFSYLQDQRGFFNPLEKNFTLEQRHPCWAAWSTMYIQSSGKAAFCGADINAGYGAGDINAEKITDVWNNDVFKKFRQSQFSREKKMFYCKACPDWSCNHSFEIFDGERKITVSPVTKVYSAFSRVSSPSTRNIGRNIKNFLTDKKILPKSVIDNMERNFRKVFK